MTPFTGQLTRLGLGGVQAIVWPDRPFYLKVFFAIQTRVAGVFQVTSA